MKNAFIEHLKKENIGIGPVDNIDQYNNILTYLVYNRVGVKATWDEACESPDLNFAIFLDSNSLKLDYSNQASKYITPEQFVDNINKESDWELN